MKDGLGYVTGISDSQEYHEFSHDITKYTDYDGHMNGEAARNYSTILGYFLRK